MPSSLAVAEQVTLPPSSEGSGVQVGAFTVGVALAGVGVGVLVAVFVGVLVNVGV